MADGFDECHKKGLSASPGVRDPLARSPAVAHEGAAQEGGAPRVSSSIYIPVIPTLIMLTY